MAEDAIGATFRLTSPWRWQQAEVSCEGAGEKGSETQLWFVALQSKAVVHSIAPIHLGVGKSDLGDCFGLPKSI